MNYASSIKRQSKEYHFDETLPIGIVLKVDGSYRLIDGYHRFASTKTQWAHYICLE